MATRVVAIGATLSRPVRDLCPGTTRRDVHGNDASRTVAGLSSRFGARPGDVCGQSIDDLGGQTVVSGGGHRLMLRRRYFMMGGPSN